MKTLYNPYNRYPKSNDSFIQKILSESLKFKEFEELKDLISNYTNRYTNFTKLLQDEEIDKSYCLWIWGFQLTEKEIKNGIQGNYAKISIAKIENDLYQATIKKIWNKNPPRTGHQIKGQHPNGSEPIIRSLKKGQKFKSFDEAREKLIELSKKYKNSVRLKEDRALIYIYSNKFRKKYGKPFKSHDFEIVEEEGLFKILIYPNVKIVNNVVLRTDDEFISLFSSKFLEIDQITEWENN